MKFSLFAHMEQSPAGAPVAALYEEFIALCEIAEAGGMHAIWTGEHHAMSFTISPNPFIAIADLARRTKNIRLGTGTVVAPFWHPVKLAGEAAFADLICGGRLEVGVARGAYSYEYERLMPGLDAMQAGLRMREIVPAVQKLWAGDYAHEGEFFQFPQTTCTPRPLRPPPIWIAARDSATHEFAIVNDCNVQVTPLWQGTDEVMLLMGRFDAACELHVRRPKIMLLQHTFVGANEAENEEAARVLSRFYCHFASWFKNERPVRGGDMLPLNAEEMAAMPAYTPAKMRENLNIGGAQAVIDRLRRYEDAGFDEYAYWADSGMDFAQKRASLCRFIDEVVAVF